jgi:hypothetical protein
MNTEQKLTYTVSFNHQGTLITTHCLTCFVSYQVAESVLGFCVMRSYSKLPGAGIGVVMARGRVKKGTLVALYPGMSMTFNLCAVECQDCSVISSL